MILAPQAIGGHVDHVAAVNAVHALAAPAPILRWRNCPRLERSEPPAGPFGRRFDAAAPVAITLDQNEALAKLTSALAYARQLGFQFGGPEALRTRLSETAGRERFASQAQDVALHLFVFGGRAKPRSRFAVSTSV